jgi:hypothetical protein
MKITTIICLGIGFFSLITASWSSAQTPTQADIEKLMRARFEKPAARGADGRTGVQINSVKIGQTNAANEQEVVDGIPPGAKVTEVLVDFTTRTYYKDSTAVSHRVQEMKLYRDKFDQLALMLGAAHGSDENSREPAR